MRGLAAFTTSAEAAEPVRNLEMFEVLSDRCLDSAYRLASVVLRDEIEAQDVVHDAVLSAWRKFGTLRETDKFDAWFGRIVLNLCRDRLRSRGRIRIRDASMARDMDVRARDDFAGVARRDAIGHAFARLDPDLQMVVALRYYRDLPLEQIAELLGTPLGTVKSRLNRGMERLRTELDRAGWREEGDR